MIEPGIDRHPREGFGEQFLRNPYEFVLLVEPMRCHEFVGCAEEEIPNAGAGRERYQLLEQAPGDTGLFASVSGLHKHLPQRALIHADVTEPNRSHDLSVRNCHPEISLAALIKSRDIEQVGLVFDRDGDTEFVTLNRQNYIDHSRHVARIEFNYLNQKFSVSSRF